MSKSGYPTKAPFVGRNLKQAYSDINQISLFEINNEELKKMLKRVEGSANLVESVEHAVENISPKQKSIRVNTSLDLTQPLESSPLRRIFDWLG